MTDNIDENNPLDAFSEHETKTTFKSIVVASVKGNYLGKRKRCCITLRPAIAKRGKTIARKLGLSFSAFMEAAINEQYRLYLMANKDVKFEITRGAGQTGDDKILDVPVPDFPLQSDVTLALKNY